MQQRFRYHDESAFDATGDNLLVQYQACLDGLSKAYFISQQDTRFMATGNLVRDVELVWQQLYSWT